jgi:hypothetical protein
VHAKQELLHRWPIARAWKSRFLYLQQQPWVISPPTYGKQHWTDSQVFENLLCVRGMKRWHSHLIADTKWLVSKVTDLKLLSKVQVSAEVLGLNSGHTPWATLHQHSVLWFFFFFFW